MGGLLGLKANNGLSQDLNPGSLDSELVSWTTVTLSVRTLCVCVCVCEREREERERERERERDAHLVS